MIAAEILATCTGADLRRAQNWLDPFNAAMSLFEITRPLRIAGFLANVGQESGSLVYVKEIWGPTPAQLRYEGRKDLGNVRPGDGRKFLGRGPIQITGRAGAARARDRLLDYLPNVPDFEQSPELMEIPRWGAFTSCLFWHDHGCDALIDAGDFDGVCDEINRGHKTIEIGDSNGYANRYRLYVGGRAALGIPLTTQPTPET